MKEIIIRKIRETDIEKLQKIGKETFHETFFSQESAHDMEQYLQEKFSVSQLSLELKNPESIFFFSEIKDKVVGYLKVNIGKAQTENKLNKALEIERIYVLSKYHAKNVGSALLDKAFEIAKDYKVQTIWLGVYEKNYRAIHFYLKNGFIEFDRHKFKFGQDESINLLMKYDL